MVSLAMTVVVYTQPGCGPCYAEKAWLAEEGIAFEERDIRQNRDWLGELGRLGARGTPTTVVSGEDGRERVVVGFDQRRLRQLLRV
jgi:glutaredoxin